MTTPCPPAEQARLAKELIDDALRERGYRPSVLHGTEFYDDFLFVAERVFEAQAQRDEVLREAIDSFLSAIIEFRGVNDHAWLVRCATDIQAALAAAADPAETEKK